MSNFPDARLEEWMRNFYFSTTIDLGSSGIEPISMRSLASLVGISHDEIDDVLFQDSWTMGDPLLRDTIANRWAQGDRARVMVTHGSSEAIYMIMNALLKTGDEIVAPCPGYQQLFSTAEALGCEARFYTLRMETGFRLDVEELKSLITDRTRMLVCNFPHNPTGTSISAEQQQQIISLARENGLHLLWDAAFAELVYESDPLPEPGQWYDQAISIGTLSKAYGLPGLRVGWCIASPATLERCVRLKDYTTLHLSPLVELIARKSIEHSRVLLQRGLRQAKANREMLEQWIQHLAGRVEWVVPQGGVCAFPRIGGNEDVDKICRDLALKHGILLVPGSCFDHPRFVRLGFGGPSALFEQGLSRLFGILGPSRVEGGTFGIDNGGWSKDSVTAQRTQR